MTRLRRVLAGFAYVYCAAFGVLVIVLAIDEGWGKRYTVPALLIDAPAETIETLSYGDSAAVRRSVSSRVLVELPTGERVRVRWRRSSTTGNIVVVEVRRSAIFRRWVGPDRAWSYSAYGDPDIVVPERWRGK